MTYKETDNFLDDAKKLEMSDEDMTPFEYWFYRMADASLKSFFVPRITELLQRTQMSQEALTALLFMQYQVEEDEDKAVSYTWV